MEVSAVVSALAFPAVVVVAAAIFVSYSLTRLRAPPVKQQPQTDLFQDDVKPKKKKTKDKKTANGQVANEAEVKSKKSPEAPKKSPEAPKKSPVKTKEQKPKPEEVKKPKPEPKPVEKKTPKKEGQKKEKVANVKPADYDDGEWEKVPSKKDKKERKKDDDKKDAPPVQEKKRGKDAKKEVKEVAEVKPKKVEVPAAISEELQRQILEMQRALSEAEKRERSQTPIKPNDTPKSSAPATPEVKPNKKKSDDANKNKKQSSDKDIETADANKSGDEVDDAWTDAKAVKKGKKKPRKDQ